MAKQKLTIEPSPMLSFAAQTDPDLMATFETIVLNVKPKVGGLLGSSSLKRIVFI